MNTPLLCFSPVFSIKLNVVGFVSLMECSPLSVAC